MQTSKSIVGSYGKWLDTIRPTLGKMSYLKPDYQDISTWKVQAKQVTEACILAPVYSTIPLVRVDRRYVYDGLSIEEISWQLSHGPRTKAIVLKPLGNREQLPGILALHDHGGQKFFGYEKITRTSSVQHPMIALHQESDYGGKAWANEIAKRGYVVMVHDVFAFGSRRIRYGEIEGINWGACQIEGKLDNASTENIEVYNQWAAEHESILAKSILSAGSTWPGIVLAEDRVALSILASRVDVDPLRLGCGGLSGGGLRTTYLAGIDDRIKCAVCVGFMTTWSDFIRKSAYKHTWMTYTPTLPLYLEFPEILALRIPLPTLIQNNSQDELFDLEQMQRATDILAKIYQKAGVLDHFQTSYYEGRHKFDTLMQTDAFAWFDKWLKC